MLAFLAAILSLALVAVPAYAQSTGGTGASSGGSQQAGPSGAFSANGVDVEESAAQSGFGAETREIRFLLRARADDRIKNVTLLYYVDDSVVQNATTPNFQPGRTVTAAYLWRVAGVLVPGSDIKYQWQIETDDGRKVTTPMQSVKFEDARFMWREFKGDQVTVYWHGADLQVGNTLLDEVKKVQAQLRTDYALTLDKPLRVYAYARATDYSSALASGSRQLEASMTVGTDRIFVLTQATSSASAASGTSGLAGAQQSLRHEVAVAMFQQKTDNPYGPPPRWLYEGFTLMLGGETISENNGKALQQLAQNNRLLALRTLNVNFPGTERDLSLAYIQSLSAVKFMYDNYGPEKVKGVMAAFKEGNTVDDALKKGLGVTLDQFETRWKNALKSGAALRTTTRPGPEAQTGPSASDSANPLIRMFGPTIDYWRGAFGTNAPIVIIGTGAFIVVGFIAVIGGTFVSWVRRARRETEDL